MSTFVLSVVVMAASMGALALGMFLTGRPPSRGCGRTAHECGASVECEGCPNAREQSENTASSEVDS